MLMMKWCVAVGYVRLIKLVMTEPTRLPILVGVGFVLLSPIVGSILLRLVGIGTHV